MLVKSDNALPDLAMHEIWQCMIWQCIKTAFARSGNALKPPLSDLEGVETPLPDPVTACADAGY